MLINSAAKIVYIVRAGKVCPVKPDKIAFRLHYIVRAGDGFFLANRHTTDFVFSSKVWYNGPRAGKPARPTE